MEVMVQVVMVQVVQVWLAGAGNFGICGNSGSSGNQGGGGGGSSSGTLFPAEGKPCNVQLPVCPYKEWTNSKELVGFRQWLDAFTHWLNLIDVRFPGEIREALQYPRKLMKGDMDQKQFERSFRLLSCLKQSLSGFPHAENIFAHYHQTEAMGECHGYEVLRRLGLELSIKSRGEVMQFKGKFMSTTVVKKSR